LSWAQSDFSSLQQLLPSGQQSSLLAPASGTQSTSPLATAVSQLTQDLKAGNLTAAQSDLSNVQQNLQQAGPQSGTPHDHHHHHHSDADSGRSSNQQNPISHSSANWDRTSSPATSSPHNRPTPRCSKTFHASALRLHREKSPLTLFAAIQRHFHSSGLRISCLSPSPKPPPPISNLFSE
jgi:hypothetical protein